MAVSQYDSKFQHKQLVELGEKQGSRICAVSDGKMNAMQARMKRLEDTVLSRLSQRDRRRAQTDPSFTPRDDDFAAPKAHAYEKTINYYEVLGLDEYVPQAEVRKVYRKFSLTYHPDKTGSLPQAEKDEKAGIFLELRNAYKTLSDNPTRRQYDNDRDRDSATHEIYGTKPKKKPNFNGFAAMQKIAERMGPSEVVELRVTCKLEKFVHGGYKLVKRRRKLEGGTSEERVFQIDVAAGAEEPISMLFRRQGDQHLDREPDSLRLSLSSKAHSRVERLGKDLQLREAVDCGGDWQIRHYLQAEVPSVQGRHLFLWGRNPLRFSNRSGAVEFGFVVHGAGLSDGALRFRLRLGLRSTRTFLERYGLGPPEGFPRKKPAPPGCTFELRPLGQAVALHSRPSCTLTFYGDAGGSLVAAGLSSAASAGKKASRDWRRFCSSLGPVLASSFFLLTKEGRGLLPRALGAAPADALPEVQQGPCQLLASWARLGKRAFGRGDFRDAVECYSRGLELADGWDEAQVLSNRAACLMKMVQYAAALTDASRAVELAPRWAKAWLRLASAAEQSGHLDQALQAYQKAVELEPSKSSVAELFAAATRWQPADGQTAHDLKEKGNEAFRIRQFGLAIALYTLGLAKMQDEDQPADSLLTAILLTNRCGAFCHLGLWDAAVDSGREAVTAQPKYPKALCQLGIASMAAFRTEEAYAAFASAAEQEQTPTTQRGLHACLTELPRWRSLSSRQRCKARFGMDLSRPRGSSRIFATSDVHFDHGNNEDWAHSIHSIAFQEDVLLVAGNLADTCVGVLRALRVLRSKFRRVFYTPGYHELAARRKEEHPDSLAKLHSLLAGCDELGVDVAPAPVSEAVFVLPLLSWYTPEFVEEDPMPDLGPQPYSGKWPMDANFHVWKYMLKLNEQHLKLPFHGEVISFSHFLPRRDLPHDESSAKTLGCAMLDEQLRSVGGVLHVYGHSHRSCDSSLEGVRYVHQPAADFRRALDKSRPLALVFDQGPCYQPWSVENSKLNTMPMVSAGLSWH